jgi:hypothetical protein
MNKIIIFLCLSFLLASPVAVNAEDPFDTGQSRMTGSETLFNMGLWVLTHPDSIKTLGEMSKEEKKEEGDLDKKLDKKVDEAIKKAWQ